MTPPPGPFSQPTRVAFIDEYFGDRAVRASEAWKDVYRLLLWADPTTGLAHCYESDKAQPGRKWYGRALAFHAWLAGELGIAPTELADNLDVMFRRALDLVAADEETTRVRLSAAAVRQREQFPAPMPKPDYDPELIAILEPILPTGTDRPSEADVQAVVRALWRRVTNENKRKNLLGRGFEDVLAGIISRLEIDARPRVGTQTPIQDIDGFRRPRDGDKDEKVDLFAITPSERRVLVSAKWSVRADREKQMRGDYRTYIDCNERGQEPFEYVWVTNEFDPARLAANALHHIDNHPMLSAVVHVCPPALHIVHELDRDELHPTLATLKELLRSGRIVGLGEWLAGLSD